MRLSLLSLHLSLPRRPSPISFPATFKVDRLPLRCSLPGISLPPRATQLLQKETKHSGGAGGAGSGPPLRPVSRTARGHGAVQGPVSAGRAGPLPGRVVHPAEHASSQEPGWSVALCGLVGGAVQGGEGRPDAGTAVHAARGKSSCGQAPSAPTAVGLLRGAVRAEKVSAAPWDESYQTI